ncbi:putative ABC transporter ATP-binding protein [Bryobacterales bacterium F-183]|nr:putative ABC transporter ATP-binding protein [Bryobacterales bacterium F-183]
MPLADSSTSLISIRGLSFAYPGGRTALDNITLDIPAGERLGIIGASGAGKSTFLLHLNGVHLPTSGEVIVAGTPVGPGTLRDVRSKVGIVFQNPDDQLFTPTVEEDVAFGPLNMGCPPQEVRDRVTEALSQMRLEEYRDRGTHELSHGEKRRVALATVLAMRPQVIGFDEPFANLDPGMVHQLIDVIRGLKATVIVISQEIIPVVACCDRIAVFHGGHLKAVGPALEIAANRPLLAECGIDFHYQGEIWRKLAAVSGD